MWCRLLKNNTLPQAGCEFGSSTEGKDTDHGADNKNFETF